MNQITPGEPLADQPDPDLVAAVRRLAHTNVLVIGDVMLDRYVYGDITRISPEAPVPILQVTREIGLPGGAGNVVRNLTALGAAVALHLRGRRRPGGLRSHRAGRRPARAWSPGCWCKAAAPPR